jgi:hypothetical protein
MNTKTLKGITAAVSLLVGLGTATSALATNTGARTLGNGGQQIDAWSFECPATFPIGQARVSDRAVINNAAAKMQLVLGKIGNPNQQVADPDGDGGALSVFATVASGPGEYIAVIKKTAVGQEDYHVDVVCRDANNGLFNNPPLTLRIDQ